MKLLPGRPRKRHNLLIGAVFFAILWACFFDRYSFYKIHRERCRAEKLKEKNMAIEHENYLLREKIKNIKSNQQAYIEQIAREKYMMKYPNERVWFFYSIK